jgi:hypothetical protein
MKIHFIFYLLYLCNSLYIELDGYNTFCINKDIQKGDIIKFYSESPEGSIIYTYLKNRDDIIYSNIFNNKILNKIDHETKARGGVYTLCYESKQSQVSVISFDIETLQETGPLIDIVKEGNISLNQTSSKK